MDHPRLDFVSHEGDQRDIHPHIDEADFDFDFDNLDHIDDDAELDHHNVIVDDDNDLHHCSVLDDDHNHYVHHGPGSLSTA